MMSPSLGSSLTLPVLEQSLRIQSHAGISGKTSEDAQTPKPRNSALFLPTSLMRLLPFQSELPARTNPAPTVGPNEFIQVS